MERRTLPPLPPPFPEPSAPPAEPFAESGVGYTPTAIVGYGGQTINSLRLWAAKEGVPPEPNVVVGDSLADLKAGPTDVLRFHVHALEEAVKGRTPEVSRWYSDSARALMIDPACELRTFMDALYVGRACDDAGYFWYEDPFRDGGVSAFAHKKLREMIKTPILQTEHVRGVEPKADFLIQGGTDFLRSDPEYDMGITGAMKIAHYDSPHGLPWNGRMWSNGARRRCRRRTSSWRTPAGRRTVSSPP